MKPVELAEQHVRECKMALVASIKDLRFARKLLAKRVEEERP